MCHVEESGPDELQQRRRARETHESAENALKRLLVGSGARTYLRGLAHGSGQSYGALVSAVWPPAEGAAP